MAAVIETTERGATELVTTHYYKTSYEKLKEVYLKVLEDNRFSIVSIDDNYCEIFAEIPHMTVLAKVTEKNPRETAIDFYIDAEYILFSKKKAYKFLDFIYYELNQKFELKGTGLAK